MTKSNQPFTAGQTEIDHLRQLLRNAIDLLRKPAASRPTSEDALYSELVAQISTAADSLAMTPPVVVDAASGMVTLYTPKGEWCNEAMPQKMIASNYEAWREKLAAHLELWLVWPVATKPSTTAEITQAEFCRLTKLSGTRASRLAKEKGRALTIQDAREHFRDGRRKSGDDVPDEDDIEAEKERIREEKRKGKR